MPVPVRTPAPLHMAPPTTLRVPPHPRPGALLSLELGLNSSTLAAAAESVVAIRAALERNRDTSAAAGAAAEALPIVTPPAAPTSGDSSSGDP